MNTGFHNYAGEVQPFSGEEATPFVTLFDATVSDVVIQIDVGHALRGGADPVALIERYPGQTEWMLVALVHIMLKLFRYGPVPTG